MARLTKNQIAERGEARAALLKILKPGDTVSTILRHVSRSGMFRRISLIYKDRDITWNAARALGEKLNRDEFSIGVSGCGMDMGFHLVYSLSRTLFPEGFGIEMHKACEECAAIKGCVKVRKRRPRSKAGAARMVANGWTARGRNGDAPGWDNDGGYALSQRWL